MTYFEGFAAPVCADRRNDYLAQCLAIAPVFRRHGAIHVVDCWHDDVPEGKVTDFRRAVAAAPGEVVSFGWLEYPDRAARDAANAGLEQDPEMARLGQTMPFDGQRLIFGGFTPIVDRRGKTSGGYADGFVVPVPQQGREAYRDLAARAAEVFIDHGAARVVEAWADDVPRGKQTDFWRAVDARPDEQVVFSFIEWPSRAARDAGQAAAMADKRLDMDPSQMPFDGKRMIWGGFARINEG